MSSKVLLSFTSRYGTITVVLYCAVLYVNDYQLTYSTLIVLVRVSGTTLFLVVSIVLQYDDTAGIVVMLSPVVGVRSRPSHPIRNLRR